MESHDVRCKRSGNNPMETCVESQGAQSSTPTASDTFFSAILRDPLSEVTRKERTYLLAVSTIGIAIVKTGLVPSQITTLGIVFEKANQNTLLFVLGLVALYFLAAFIIYATADFFAWLVAYQSVLRRASPLQEELNSAADAQRNREYSALRKGIPDTSDGDSTDVYTIDFYKGLHTRIKSKLLSTETGRRAEELGLVTWETTYPEDAPPIYRVYIGEEPSQRTARRRVRVIAASTA